MSNLALMRVISPGYAITVSLKPDSPASGGRFVPGIGAAGWIATPSASVSSCCRFAYCQLDACCLPAGPAHYRDTLVQKRVSPDCCKSLLD